MKTHVEFRSDQFPAYEGEELDVNPGRFGKRLAEFLAEGLMSRGFIVDELTAEDWGWAIPINIFEFKLWIGCGNYNEYKDGFLCFIEPHTPSIRKLFKTVNTQPVIVAIQKAMDEILSEHAGIFDKKWWTYEELNNPTQSIVVYPTALSRRSNFDFLAFWTSIFSKYIPDKSAKSWIYVRWFLLVISMIVWFGGCALGFQEIMTHSVVFHGLIWLIMPFGLNLIFTYYSLHLFPINYGCLGWRKRSPCPKEPYRLKVENWLKLAGLKFRKGEIGIYFYRTGFEIMCLYGRFFMPWKSIVSIEQNSGHCVLNHNCEEVRSPIIFPAESKDAILRAIQHDPDRRMPFYAVNE